MLASRFSEELRKRKQDYSELVTELHADGQLDHADLKELEQARTDLCISESDADTIHQDVALSEPCPYCAGKGTVAPK